MAVTQLAPGQKMYMVVGFEVVACSIKREAGQAINKNLMCPQSLDDPNAPTPQEVKKGALAGWLADWRLGGCSGRLECRWWGWSRWKQRAWCGEVKLNIRWCLCVCLLRAHTPPTHPRSLPHAGEKIVYTYDVYWEAVNTPWSSRWDAYLRMPGGKVHWFSILNSLMVVVVMSCIVAMIMMRTIRRDLQRYEQLLVDGGEH